MCEIVPPLLSWYTTLSLIPRPSARLSLTCVHLTEALGRGRFILPVSYKMFWKHYAKAFLAINALHSKACLPTDKIHWGLFSSSKQICIGNRWHFRWLVKVNVLNNIPPHTCSYCCPSVMPRPYPLSVKDNLVNQVEFLCTFVAMSMKTW